MAGSTLSSNETRISEVVRAVRELFQGRGHNVGEVTLTANAATTVVTHANCGESSIPKLTPRTANAAAALATTYIAVANVVPGQFTINHANNAQVDKTFGYVLGG